jgi:hypothetical protein
MNAAADSLLIDTLDERRENVCLGIGSSGSKQDIVWVPVDRKYSRPDGLLDVLGHPPIVLFIERTDSDGPVD